MPHPSTAYGARSRSPKSKAKGPALRRRSPSDEQACSSGEEPSHSRRHSAELLRQQALEASLPAELRERLQRLADEGALRQGAFDADSLAALAALPLGLQERVLEYLESERVYLMNSRSKSGFLVAACDRAKAGALDARGMGAQDPWRSCLLAIAVPKRGQIDLVPESQWLQQCGTEPAHILVDVGIDKDVGVTKLTLALAVTHTVAYVKNRLAAVGVTIPIHKMQLREDRVGFLKNDRTLAFYNIQSGSLLHMVYKTRAGIALRRGKRAMHEEL